MSEAPYDAARLDNRGRIVSVLHSELRLIAGNCPACGAVIAVVNHGEGWPLLTCRCGWQGDTHAPLNKVRLECVVPPDGGSLASKPIMEAHDE